MNDIKFADLPKASSANQLNDKGRIIRVAMIKAEASWGDCEGNIELLARLARGMAKQTVDIVITPECFLDGYMVRDRKRCTVRKLAARCVSGVSDPLVKPVRNIARKLGAYLVFGASEKDRAGVVRNAAFVFGRTGEHVGTYYKVVPDRFYAPGNALPVFNTDFGKVGVVICADRRWPEHMRCLRLDGAEVIFNPTWGWFGNTNTAIMQTRAYENGIPVCFAHPQQALICLPDASIGAVLESNLPGVLVHDLDLGRNVPILESIDKASGHPVQNRRPDLYSAITRNEPASPKQAD